MVRIGHCGWNSQYLYDAGIRSKDRLRLYSGIFDCVEVNSTFYSIPTQKSVDTWYQTVPEDFRFSIKLNRLFTHDQPLEINGETVLKFNQFIASTSRLKEKLAWYLLQLPPSLRSDLPKLERFLTFARDTLTAHGCAAQLAVEFRHGSWYDGRARQLLKDHGAVQVISSSPGKWPLVWVREAGGDYIRLHGLHEIYSSSYTRKELEKLADWLSDSPSGNSWVLFDNTATPAARDNSLFLKQHLGQPVPEESVQLQMDLK